MIISFFLSTEQLSLPSVHLLLVDPADELVLLHPELHVQLLLEVETSCHSFQIILQLPLPVSGHQELPVEHCCSPKEQNQSQVGPLNHSSKSIFMKTKDLLNGCHLDVF